MTSNPVRPVRSMLDTNDASDLADQHQQHQQSRISTVSTNLHQDNSVYQLETPISGDSIQTKDIPSQPANSQTSYHATVVPDSADNHHGAIVQKISESEKYPHASQALPNSKLQDYRQQLREEFSPDSHDLTSKDYGLQGAVQNPDSALGTEVRDIGWHRGTAHIPDPLIGGLPNGRLFSRIRRFNKDVFDVRACPLQTSRGLDLNESWSEEYIDDKLPLHLQRFYLSIILGMASLGKQISRLRSWKEKRRTSVFCAVYFLAWFLDLLTPLILGMLIAVVSSKQARDHMFPPAPLAAVDIATGGLQKPQAGQLGTTNTLTGAPEKLEGEAVEEEAANFADNIRHLFGRAVGMHSKNHAEGGRFEKRVPKPLKRAAKAVHSAGSAPGHAEDSNDLTQKPMEELLWDKLSPEKLESFFKIFVHSIGETVDNWERFENAISPTPPFSKRAYLRINAVLIPAFLASFLIDHYMVYKAIGFAIGFGFFGDPILTPTSQWLNKKHPKWMELLEPKNNILRGVPTHNQLTLTLLRIGETHKTPIPPLPTSTPNDPDRELITEADDIPLEATDTEINEAIYPSAMEKAHPQHGGDHEEKEQPTHKKLSKVIRILKGNTQAVVNTKLAIDHVRSKSGSERAKEHLGVLPKKKNIVLAGPSEYKGRYDGKSGWIHLTENAVSFSLKERENDKPPEVKILVNDIKRLKRVTAFSIKAAEGVAGWGHKEELLGSVEIDDVTDRSWRFTAVPERDALFNRLIAIGSQKWENM
ncbi:hypothetical protein AA313_de0205767 [Arthrobotrys entomopaga]|nr:hypothetical protein AA313_de0205767 [Arthrobotrys entomopaga]